MAANVANIADLPTIQDNVPQTLPQPKTQDKSDGSGDIKIIGDALYIHWELDEGTNTLDVKLKTILEITLAHAEGTFNQDEVKIDGGFDVRIASGNATIEAVWQQTPGGDAPGLWLKADLTVLGKQVEHINWQVVSW